MADGPRLVHGGRPITTDATLRRDLERSLQARGEAAMTNEEIANRLAEIDLALIEIHARLELLASSCKLLASNDVEMSTLVYDTITRASQALSAIAPPAQQELGE